MWNSPLREVAKWADYGHGEWLLGTNAGTLWSVRFFSAARGCTSAGVNANMRWALEDRQVQGSRRRRAGYRGHMEDGDYTDWCWFPADGGEKTSGLRNGDTALSSVGLWSSWGQKKITGVRIAEKVRGKGGGLWQRVGCICSWWWWCGSHWLRLSGDYWKGRLRKWDPRALERSLDVYWCIYRVKTQEVMETIHCREKGEESWPEGQQMVGMLRTLSIGWSHLMRWN